MSDETSDLEAWAIGVARVLAGTFISAEEAARNMQRQLETLPTMDDCVASLSERNQR